MDRRWPAGDEYVIRGTLRAVRTPIALEVSMVLCHRDWVVPVALCSAIDCATAAHPQMSHLGSLIPRAAHVH